MNLKTVISLICLSLILNAGIAQKKSKAPSYTPITGLEEGHVGPLVLKSLDELNNADVKLSKEKIILESADFNKMSFRTNYLHYVAMMMHRRAKVQFEYKGSTLHIKLVELAVQNQNNGGEWEDSKLPLKADKKIQDKLAQAINNVKADGSSVQQAMAEFYSNPAMLTLMLGKEGFNKEMISNNMNSLGTGLQVVDADLNSGAGGQYKITYQYKSSTEEPYANNVRFIQYTDNETATALTKDEKIDGIKECKVLEITSAGEVIFTSGSIVRNYRHNYDYKKLVDTEPISGINFKNAFPVIYAVLNEEGIKVHKINTGDRFMTTEWVKIEGTKVDGLLTFYFDENKIWPYFLQIINEKGKNTSCPGHKCQDMITKLSNKIVQTFQSSDIIALQEVYYNDPDVNEIVNGSGTTTTLSKKLWEQHKAKVN